MGFTDPSTWNSGGATLTPNQQYPNQFVDSTGTPQPSDPSTDPVLQAAANQGLPGQAAPAQAILTKTGAQLALQLADVSNQATYQGGLLKNQYGNQLAGLGLQGQRLDVQRAALGRQTPLLTTLHDLQNAGLNRNAAANLRDLNSSLTSRGAFTSINGNSMRSDIANTLADQLKESDTRFNEDIASVQDQNKFLDIQGQQLGLDRNQLKNSLEQGLARLGLQSMMDISQLQRLIDSNAIDQVMLGQQIFNSAIGASDYFSQFYGQTSLQRPGAQGFISGKAGAQ